MKQLICNYCNSKTERFLPYKNGNASYSSSIRLLNFIGSDVENYMCPNCGCSDRERHLKIYMEATNLIERVRSSRILHFAPERSFSNYLGNYNPEVHIFADIESSNGRYEKIDIEDIPYGDNSFDFVIANHVLEHVIDFPKALSEINRVLKSDGFAIIQTPFSSTLQNTFEDPGISSDELKDFFYGQDDHARLFGSDIFKLFSNYLTPSTLSHADVESLDDTVDYGVNSQEPFFLYKKKMDSISPAPLVSIACVTFNHEKYISSALDSFLLQKTNFKYEIIVSDDCSTDSTRLIIENYKRKYPELIKIAPNVSNIGYRKNIKKIIEMCTGKYIAFCEGDDYWTDKNKLQLQIDFLQNNANYSIVYGSVNSHKDNLIDYNYIGGVKRDISSEELKMAPALNTLTCTFRNLKEEIPYEFLTTGSSDMFLWSLLGWHGSGKYLTSILPSIYRQHGRGVHSSKSTPHKIKLELMTMYSLVLYYTRINQQDLAEFFCSRCLSNMKSLRNILDDNEYISEIHSLKNEMIELAYGNFEFNHHIFDQVQAISLKQTEHQHEQ